MIRIESPIIAEWEARFEQRGELKGKQEAILTVLDARFGTVPEDLAVALRRVDDPTRLTDLNRFAGTCPDLESFRLRLAGK